MSFFRRRILGHAVETAAVVVLIALVIGLRLLPDRLAAAEPWAQGEVRAQVAGQLDPRLPPAQREAAIDGLLRNNPEVVADVKADLEAAFRDDVTFTGEDGRRHLYLGGDDDYYFLRQAQSVLARGSICGAEEDGQCIDTQADAPLGRVVDTPLSPHPYAIAALHRLLVQVQPGLPLAVSADLLPTVLTVLAVPVLVLGLRRWLSPLATLLAVAVALLGMPPLVRSLGADNDIWAILLPALALVAVCRALESHGPRILGLAALSGGLVGILAGAWGGWHLFAAVFLTALAGLAAWRMVARQSARAECLALVGFTGGLATLAIPLTGHLDIVAGLRDILGALSLGGPPQLPAAGEPDAFAYVGELQAVAADAMGHYYGFPVFLFGLVGSLLALLPGTWPGRWRLGAAAGLLAATGAVTMLAAAQAFTVLAGGVAIGAALLMALRTRHGPSGQGEAPAPLVLFAAVWLFAALVLSGDGQRYVLFLATPLGLGVGLGLDALDRGIRRLPLRVAAGVAAAAVLAIPLLSTTVAEARFQVPRVNDAWAEVLARVRQDTPPDTPVTTWWDFGHWTASLAERPVTIDGASLRYRTIHWVGRALATPDPAEAVGLLRILACGALPDGTRPFEALLGDGVSPATAFTIVTEAATVPRETTAAALAETALPSARREAVLNVLHCTPPAPVLVTTTALFTTPAWGASAAWRPDGAAGSGFTTADAAAWSTKWHSCTVLPSKAAACPLGLRSVEGIALNHLEFDPADPTTLVIAATLPDGRPAVIRPSLVRLALPDGLYDFTPAAEGSPLAVIVEPQNSRVFVTSPGIARSFLARLALLGGRYDSDRVDKLAEVSSVRGESVAAWRLR